MGIEHPRHVGLIDDDRLLPVNEMLRLIEKVGTPEGRASMEAESDRWWRHHPDPLVERYGVYLRGGER